MVVGGTGVEPSISTPCRADPRSTANGPGSAARISPQLTVRLPVAHEICEIGLTSVEIRVVRRRASPSPR